MIISSFAGLLTFLVATVLVLALPVALFWLLYKATAGVCWVLWRGFAGLGVAIAWVFRTIGFSISHVFTFVKSTVLDTLRLAGALLTSVFMVPPVLGSVFLGRWSAANHYGRAFERELKEAWIRAYRLVIGNPVRLLGLRPLIEGVEDRLPDVVAHSPGADRPRGGEARFPGYEVTGSLPRGGSGARLYVAEPTAAKRDDFARSETVCPGRVVIKAFSLEDGSTLPQIVRESRALTAAKELGLVLDHSLEQESFWYVMPYVSGEDLAEVARRLHRKSGDPGLSDAGLREVLDYTAQLLATCERFHAAGLWHKDIKPANVIVSPARGGTGHAHLVDFGLVTPLRSAMTLTTHGTEYFRDPEMVRLAMQGVKVHEVDGVKFDLYSLGAVLFSLVENSFPAHGSLSQITRRCPEALRWIVRRAMADTKNRYGSAREMLADVAFVLESPAPFDLGPADLPSFQGDAALAAAIDPSRFAPPPTAGFAPLPETPAPDAGSEKVKPVRRRVHPAVVGTSLLLTAACAGGLLLAASGTTVRHVRSATATSHAGLFPLAIGTTPRSRHADATHHHGPTATAPAPGAARIGCYVHEDHVHHDEDCDGHHAPDASPSIAARDGEPFDVLIVNDLPPSVDDELVREIESSLRTADAVPHGLALDDEREVDWLAEARRTAGLAFPFDAEAEARLRTYLRENEALDAIVWLGVGETGEIVHRLYGAEPEALPAPGHHGGRADVLR